MFNLLLITLSLMCNAISTEGPLPEAVVAAYEECYIKVKGGLPNFTMTLRGTIPKCILRNLSERMFVA